MARPLLHHIDTGPNSSAVPVVLLHAFPLSHDMWSAQIAGLRDRYRVIACDLPGFGKSVVEESYPMMEHMVDAVAMLFDHLRVGAVALAGLSLGGYVALRFAERHPERVAGLALCDTRAEADTDASKLARAQAMVRLHEHGLSAFADGFFKTAFAKATFASKPEIIEEARRLVLRHSESGLRHALVALATRTDTTGVLGGLSVPVTVLVGEHDELTPKEVAKALASRILGATLDVIADAGHMTALEQPEAVTRALARWLDRVNAAALDAGIAPAKT